MPGAHYKKRYYTFRVLQHEHISSVVVRKMCDVSFSQYAFMMMLPIKKKWHEEDRRRKLWIQVRSCHFEVHLRDYKKTPSIQRKKSSFYCCYSRHATEKRIAVGVFAISCTTIFLSFVVFSIGCMYECHQITCDKKMLACCGCFFFCIIAYWFGSVLRRVVRSLKTERVASKDNKHVFCFTQMVSVTVIANDRFVVCKENLFVLPILFSIKTPPFPHYPTHTHVFRCSPLTLKKNQNKNTKTQPPWYLLREKSKATTSFSK